MRSGIRLGALAVLVSVFLVWRGGVASASGAPSGPVLAWGNNWTGGLGNGSTTSSPTPVQVAGISTATRVAAGDFHNLALPVQRRGSHVRRSTKAASWASVAARSDDRNPGFRASGLYEQFCLCPATPTSAISIPTARLAKRKRVQRSFDPPHAISDESPQQEDCHGDRIDSTRRTADRADCRAIPPRVRTWLARAGTALAIGDGSSRSGSRPTTRASSPWPLLGG